MSKIKTVDRKGFVLTFKWNDDFSQEFDVASLPREIILQLATDRAKAKLEDAHASLGPKGVEACRKATTDVWDALAAGKWERGRGTGTPWLVTALEEIFGDALPRPAREIFDDEDARKKAYKLPEVRKWKAARDLADAEDAPETDVTKLF